MPSSIWMGRFSPSNAVRSSGLWNVRNVGDNFDPSGLKALEKWIDRMDSSR